MAAATQCAKDVLDSDQPCYHIKLNTPFSPFTRMKGRTDQDVRVATCNNMPLVVIATLVLAPSFPPYETISRG